MVPNENALIRDARYYTRKAEDAAIGGPFSGDELRSQLETGELSGDDRILEAIGQNLGRLKRTPLDEWTRLDVVFELTKPRHGNG